MPLNILHISDIHFKDYQNNTYLDLDKDIQTEIELDLKNLKTVYKSIDAIFIGGDIAFSGAEEEFEIAYEWIKKITHITGCKEENVLTVPGNHDVERDKIDPVVELIQSDFRKYKTRPELDRKIEKFFTSEQSVDTILQPLHNYNNFAQKYGSTTGKRNRLYWEKDFVLDERIFRVRGLNSALISNKSDDKDSAKLILGSQQCQMLREEGVIYSVLCHHPTDWIYDGNEAYLDFKARARLHLFGHKHEFETEIIEDLSLRLAAGAMQPSRRESDWEPRYNIIQLSIIENSDSASLEIKVYKRIWEKSSKTFIADSPENELEYERFILNLTKQESEKHPEACSNTVNESVNYTPIDEPTINPNKMNPIRAITYRFLGLPYHKKLGIAVKLNLIDEQDGDLTETKRSEMYLKRAQQKNLFSKLWEEINMESEINLNNPFK